MRRFASLAFASLLLAACTSRGDHGTTDSGPRDLGAVDTGASGDGGGDAGHDAGADAGSVDLGVDAPDLGEPCGATFCGAGSYCCAPECNLCYSDSRVCGGMPCAGIDAGPRDMGTTPDMGTGATCSGVVCSPGTACMACATPFGTTHVCIPLGATC